MSTDHPRTRHPAAQSTTGSVRAPTTGGIVQELVATRRIADKLKEQNVELRREISRLRRQLAAAKTQTRRVAKLAEARP